MHIILTKASLWRKFWYFKQYLAQTMPNVGLNWSFLFSKHFLLHGMTSVILWGFGSEGKLTNSILICLKLRLNALFPVCLIRFPSVPLVVLLSSVQISGGWYNGRHFCQSNQNNSKWRLIWVFVKKTRSCFNILWTFFLKTGVKIAMLSLKWKTKTKT